jgi:DNA-binding PadR family transcriptional regulator
MSKAELTPLSYSILLALADEARHGYGIIKEIEARSGPRAAPTTGAMYLALQRLEGEGLIEEAPRTRERARTDARRRYYRLTAAGRRAAQAETRRLAVLLGVAVDKRLVPGSVLKLGGDGGMRG